MNQSENDPEDMDIEELSHEYLRAVDDSEARKESFLADVAEEYYRPGYLSDDEWETVKDCMAAGRFDDVMVVVEVAIYRKVSVENERWDIIENVDEDFPAKPSHL